MTPESELARRMAACHPLVMMGAADEVRAVRSIDQAVADTEAALVRSQRSGMQILVVYWSSTDGVRAWPPPCVAGASLVDPGRAALLDEAVKASKAAGDLAASTMPSKALEVVHRLVGTDGDIGKYVRDQGFRAYAVIFDALPYLTRKGDHVRLERRLKDVAQGAAFGNMVITLDPVLPNAPTSLRSLASIIQWGLPEQDELLQYVKEKLPGVKGITDEVAAACAGLQLPQARLAVSLAATSRGGVRPTNVLSHKKRIFTADAQHVDIHEPTGGLSDIGGMDLLKKWLVDRARIFTPEARAFGIPEPKGALVLGPPGTGKSLAARTIGAAWELAILQLDMSRITDKYFGESENRLRETLQAATSMAPCVLWIDELEKAFSSGSGTNEASVRMLGLLLTWMQDNRGVFVVATANDIRSLPPELLRKGRFDEIFFVDFPSPADAAEILSVHLMKKGRTPSEVCDLHKVARRAASRHLTGAEIEAAINAALVKAFSAGEPDITERRLLAEIEKTATTHDTYTSQLDELKRWADQGGIIPASSGRLLEKAAASTVDSAAMLTMNSEEDATTTPEPAPRRARRGRAAPRRTRRA